jgi:ergothioneine biosynthesis protein EgtB
MQRARNMEDVALWTARFEQVRRRTLQLCAPLSIEDQLVQPMADASPSKWHLAHTTWFFESFVLGTGAAGVAGVACVAGVAGVDGLGAFDPAFTFLFNSYYEAVGPRVERPRRGMLSRPSLERVRDYRAAVDERMVRALAHGQLDAAALERLELGLHHEQQHQELILTDIKYVLGTQPTQPAYVSQGRGPAPSSAPRPRQWRSFDGGIYEIGAGAGGFSFDNERPRHRVLVPPFRLATRPVSNGDVLAFLAAGGYRDAQWWLSDGWHAVQSERWTAPLYWELRDDSSAWLYELAGVRPIDPGEPACHLSYYEADAIARWSGARLPTEQEWEVAAQLAGGDCGAGNFADGDRLHPSALAAGGEALEHLFGDVWEWTSSSYTPYPGFRPLAGALGEYNGKFMSGQQVLRGGSCFTPRDHLRASYRNFFPPAARWQMTGVRLAADVDAPRDL